MLQLLSLSLPYNKATVVFNLLQSITRNSIFMIKKGKSNSHKQMKDLIRLSTKGLVRRSYIVLLVKLVECSRLVISHPLLCLFHHCPQMHEPRDESYRQVGQVSICFKKKKKKEKKAAR